ncbi:30S ribosomal protein S6 [Eubacterium sp. AB3007]|uniref:30S ribosomal protein S6 n=1 Tax=Eubacterium sp. AB3007 TaxID=1392487 RepID=UPI000486BBD3|nr:30S ribosomal protein S6 [Eubacterium sp. AB3007]
MTNYELMFIINPTLEEEKKNTVVEMVQGIITDNGGEVSNVDVWGMRKLAYLIEKKSEGYYVVIEFKAGTDLPKELDRRLRISDNVMRHMIINKDAK